MKGSPKALFSVLLFASAGLAASGAEAGFGVKNTQICEITGADFEAFDEAVELNSKDSARGCTWLISFIESGTVTMAKAVEIGGEPVHNGFGTMISRPSNVSVILDSSAWKAICPIRVHAGARIDIKRIVIKTHDAAAAVCDIYGNPLYSGVDADGHVVSQTEAQKEMVYIHPDVTIIGTKEQPAQEKPTCSIDVTYPSGGGFDVGWTTANATEVFASCGDLLKGTFRLWDTKSGHEHVNSSSQTTCGLYAEGPGGTCTDSVKVTPPKPVAPPTCALTKTAALSGGYDLAWTTDHATSATLSDGQTTLSTDLNSSSPLHVDPTDTTTYKLSASGAGGSCQDVEVVVVTPAPAAPPTCDLNSAANPNGGFDLTWITAGAVTADVRAEGSPTPLSTDTNSAAPVNVDPPQTTVYRLTATGPGGGCQDLVVVTVTPSPAGPTCDLTAAVNGNGFDLTWVSTGGATAMLSDGANTLSTELNPASPVFVTPASDTSYTLTVTGTGGTCSETIVLGPGSVVPTPPTCQLTASASGDGFDLVWTSTQGTSADLSDGTSTLSTELDSSAPLHVTPSSSTTYTLTVAGMGGSCSKAVTLGSGSPPPTCNLSSTPSSGGGFDLSWTTIYATEVSVTEEDNATALSTETNASSPVHVAPASATLYTLTATGPGGICSRTVTLAPGTAPASAPICVLTTEPSAAGGFNLTWITTNATTVTLKEGDQSLSGEANSSSPLSVNPSAPTAYTLEANGPGGTCKWITSLGPVSSGSGSSNGGGNGVGGSAGGNGGGGPDTDGDGIPDGIEINTFETDPAKADSDGDGLSDGEEVQSPFFPACGPTDPDCDDDGVCDGPGTVKDVADNIICAPVVEGQGDNCRLVSNGPNTAGIAAADIQNDSDGNGVGDVCEGDRDGDTIPDEVDNCGFIPNQKQEDVDANGIGDACDPGFSFTTLPSAGGCGCRVNGIPDDQETFPLVALLLSLGLIGVVRHKAS